MKKMTKPYFVALIAISAMFDIPLNAQIASGYEIANWYQFHTAAISYTFDDNIPKQLTVALPLFDHYNFKVTFFVITGNVTDWSRYIAASINGHEVASHTVIHKKFSTLAVADQDRECSQSQIAIKANIKFSDCSTIAYPGCSVGDFATVQKYYIAARVCSNVVIPSTPADFFRISSIITGSTGIVQTTQQFNDEASTAKLTKGWCVFLTHAIDDNNGYSSTLSSELASHLAYVNSNISDFWVATFENVVKYIKERNALSISEISMNSDTYKVMVTDNLIDSVYNVPVTVRRKLPDAWTSARVYQNNELIISTISSDDTNKYIVFDVIPNKADIVLTKSDETSVLKINTNNIFKVELNPFTNKVRIFTTGAFQYAIYNLSGSQLEHGNGELEKEIGVELSSGLYILKVCINNQIYSDKLIKI